MAAIANRHRGKVAIVTGAGQGIGKGIATRLTQEGATVIIAEYDAQRAQDAAAEVNRNVGQAIPYEIDIGDVDQIQTMVDEVVAQHGRIDILVNNAGVLHTMPFDEITPEEWDWLQRVNQRGLFFCLQRVAVQMVKQQEAGGNDAQPSGCHRQSVLRGRPQRAPLCGALLGGQVGGHQHHAERGRVAGAAWHHCQRHLSRHCRDANVGGY